MGSTAGDYGASYGDHEDHPSLRSSGYHPYDDRRSGHGRRRNNYYGGGGPGGHAGSIDTTITHLDDHAEQLWLNSPAIRAAASAAAAAAAEAAEATEESLGRPGTDAVPGGTTGQQQQVSPTPTDDGALSSDLTPDPKLERLGEGVEGGEPGPAVGKGTGTNEQGEGSSDSEVLGGESPDSPAALGPPTLRTHTDLGDLELAAEKALDLLRDEGADVLEGGGDLARGDGGDIGGGGGGGDGDGDGGSIASESRGSGDGVEKASPSSDAPAGQEGGGGARVSTRSRGAPPQERTGGVAVRLRTGSSTESTSTAALPVRGLRTPGRGARGEASRQKQQEQPERQETVGSAETAAEGTEKSKKKKVKPREATGDGEGNASPTTPEVSGVPASPNDVAASPPPRDEAGGDGGSDNRRRHSASFVAVAARAVSPAVCRIDMEKLVGTHGAPFGDVETGQGSGLIFSSEEGLVLTNAHVVAGARKVRGFVVIGGRAGPIEGVST